MGSVMKQSDAERVLNIIESLVDHVPDTVKAELESLKELLNSPLFYQYLDCQDLQKIAQLTNSGTNAEDFCEQVQNLRLSDLQIEECSNMGTEMGSLESSPRGFEGLVQGRSSTLGSSPSGTLKQEDTLQPHDDTLKPEEDTLRQLVCQQEAAMRGSQHGLTNGAFSRGSRKVSIRRERVALERGPGESLGFNVCGTVDQDTPGPVRLFVQTITAGGLADRDGKLKQGDEIVAIDGEDMSDNFGGPEATQQVLKKLAEKTGTLVFTVKRKMVLPEPLPPAEIPLPPPNPLSLANRTLIIEPDLKVLRPVQVELLNGGGGIGLGIVDDVWGNVRVNTVLQDSPASQEMLVQQHDVLLEINGAMVRGLNQDHVAHLLQCASPHVSLLLGRPTDIVIVKTETQLEGVAWQPRSTCPETGGVKVLSSPANSPLNTDDIILQVNDLCVELIADPQLADLIDSARNVTFHRKPTIEEENLVTVSNPTPEEQNRLKAIWGPEIQSVEFEKLSSTLGISILPLIDPLDSSRNAIVIDSIREESGLIGRVSKGSRLTSINDQVFNDASFDIVARVMKMTPSGPVRMTVMPLLLPPQDIVDSSGRVIQQTVITVSNNSDFPGITLKPSGHSMVPGFVVCRILTGGLFDSRLRAGDIIVSLNYANTTLMSLKSIRAMIEASCQSPALLRVSYVSGAEAAKEYTVIVPRHPQTGIGIAIVGGASADKPTNGIFIKKIVDIKSALKRGEQILKVNDIPMCGLTHDEAVEILRTATSPLTLTLQSPDSSPEAGPVETIPAEPDNMFPVRLPGPGETLGMQLGTCEQGLLITNVEDNSVAEVLSLKAGDVIFKVNDTILRGVPQDMMMPLLRQQDGPVNVTVVRKPPRKHQVTPVSTGPSTQLSSTQLSSTQVSSTQGAVTVHKTLASQPATQPASNTSSGPKQNAFTVHIKKSGTTSLGINVVQKGNGIFVKNIVADFPASQCNNIKPGDQILAVNEHALTGISRIKAIAVLRKVEGDVTLLVTRPTLAVTAVVNSSSDKENAQSVRSASPYVEVDTAAPLNKQNPNVGPLGNQNPNLGPLGNQSPDWQREPSTRSSEPDIPALRRTDNITPDNLSLRSLQSDARGSLEKLVFGNTLGRGFSGSPSLHDRTTSPSLHDRVSTSSTQVTEGSMPAVHDAGSLPGSNVPTPASSVRSRSREDPERRKSDTRSSDGRSGDARNGDGRNGDGRNGDGRNGDGRNGDGRGNWADGTRFSETGSARDSPVLRRTDDTQLSSLSSDRRISWHDTPIEVDTIRMQLQNDMTGSGVILISQPHPDGIIVKSVIPNSPAQQLIWPQDLITRLGENSTRDMAVSDAAILLSEKRATIGLEVRRDSPRYLISTVSLHKPKSGSLGLSITERRSLPGIYVSQVTPGGVAESHGAVQKGQRILSINGVNVKFIRQPEFVSVLKNCGTHVELALGTAILQDMDNRSTTSSHRSSPLSISKQIRLGSQPSNRGSPYSSQRSLHSPRGSGPLLRPSPPSSPLLHRQSPHGSPRPSQHSYSSPHGSPRASLRSGNTPMGSPRDYRDPYYEPRDYEPRDYEPRDYEPRDYDHDRRRSGSPRDPFDQGSYQGSHREFAGSRASSYRETEPGRRETEPGRRETEPGRQPTRKPRHPSPSRSGSSHSRRSTLTERSEREGLGYTAASVHSGYSHTVQSLSTHSVQSYESKKSSYSKPKPPVLRTANLYREKSGPLGLSLGGGKGWPLGSIPLFISALSKGGLALRSGVLKEKDRILSINGTNVEEYTHEDAVRILKEATSPVTLVVTDSDTNRPDFKMVKLARSPDGFGFSIVGGKDNIPPLPITIKQVFESGPAYGKLKRGDQIISVNGKSIEEYTREDATCLLKSCTETVTLVLQ